MIQRMMHFVDVLTDEELDKIQMLAEAAEEQRVSGGKDWPGKPCRQRLDLFLALTPQTTLILVAMARRMKETPHA